VERAGARGSRAEGGGGGEAAAQWGPCRRSCTGERCPFEEPGRDGRVAAGARRRRRARGGRGRVRTGGVAAREDGGRATTAARRRRSGGRRHDDGGLAGGGAKSDCRARERNCALRPINGPLFSSASVRPTKIVGS
jgi:hypothetical protein